MVVEASPHLAFLSIMKCSLLPSITANICVFAMQHGISYILNETILENTNTNPKPYGNRSTSLQIANIYLSICKIFASPEKKKIPRRTIMILESSHAANHPTHEQNSILFHVSQQNVYVHAQHIYQYSIYIKLCMLLCCFFVFLFVFEFHLKPLKSFSYTYGWKFIRTCSELNMPGLPYEPNGWIILSDADIEEEAYIHNI